MKEQETGRLILCATPIGNLEDITLRALRVLGEVDLIAAEDTRRTRRLLTHYEIKTPLTSYHRFNERHKAGELIKAMLEGKKIALVSDAGLPGISDPGAFLVKEALVAGLEVDVLPGPSAILSALVVSGLDTSAFAFEGFLPREKVKRRKKLLEIREERRTLVFYEAPHRLQDTLLDMESCLGDRQCALARELSKFYEEIWRGKISDLREEGARREWKGEMTLVITGRDEAGEGEKICRPALTSVELAREVEKFTGKGLEKRSAMKLVAKEQGVTRREVYSALLQEKKE